MAAPGMPVSPSFARSDSVREASQLSGLKLLSLRLINLHLCSTYAGYGGYKEIEVINRNRVNIRRGFFFVVVVVFYTPVLVYKCDYS